MSFLINKCLFGIGDMIFKQDIGIPMGIDPAPFWDNLFRYFFESNYIKQFISNGSSKAYKYHEFSRSIDNLCAINNSNELLKSFENVHPKTLELKVEHQGNHASF